MNKQCSSCGGDCGRTEKTGCRYQGRARNLLTSTELEDIKAIVAKWSYATEACIESYLLGINRRRKAMFDFTYNQDAAISKAEAMWGTENTAPREKLAFKDGYHAAMCAINDSPQPDAVNADDAFNNDEIEEAKSVDQSQDALDAERYRWINDAGATFYVGDVKHHCCDSAMDQYIDAAIAAKKAGV